MNNINNRQRISKPFKATTTTTSFSNNKQNEVLTSPLPSSNRVFKLKFLISFTFMLLIIGFAYRYLIPEAQFPDRLAHIPSNSSPIDNDLYDEEHNANEWFDPNGFARGLHVLNKARIDYFYSIIQGHFSNKMIGDSTTIQVLDVGCGGGIGTEQLFQKSVVEQQQGRTSLKLNMTGIEPSSRSIRVAKEHYEQSELFRSLHIAKDDGRISGMKEQQITSPSLQYVVGSAYDLSAYPDESIDVVISSDVMDHLFDLRGAMKEVDRVLKKKTGLFIFETINRSYSSFLWVQRLAEWAGLVPHGTHDYRLFVTIDEIHRLVSEESRGAMRVKEVKGTRVEVGLGWYTKEVYIFGDKLKFNITYPWPAMTKSYVTDSDTRVGIIGYAIKE